MNPKQKQWFKGVFFAYVFLWVLTATWGLLDVDRSFDREFKTTFPNVLSFDPFVGSTNGQTEVERLSGICLRDPYGIVNPENARKSPKTYWRCRTAGFPIAPFLIIDEAGAQWGPTAGVGGRRLMVWFFGWSHYWWIQHYWLS